MGVLFVIALFSQIACIGFTTSAFTYSIDYKIADEHSVIEKQPLYLLDYYIHDGDLLKHVIVELERVYEKEDQNNMGAYEKSLECKVMVIEKNKIQGDAFLQQYGTERKIKAQVVQAMRSLNSYIEDYDASLKFKLSFRLNYDKRVYPNGTTNLYKLNYGIGRIEGKNGGGVFAQSASCEWTQSGRTFGGNTNIGWKMYGKTQNFNYASSELINRDLRTNMMTSNYYSEATPSSRSGATFSFVASRGVDGSVTIGFTG